MKNRPVLAAVAALGFSCVITQLALLRELLAAFSGNEMVLGVVLGLWLLLLGLGTALGGCRVGTPRRGVRPSQNTDASARRPYLWEIFALGRRSSGLRNPLTSLAWIQMLLALLPLAQVFLLRALRNVVFIRGAAVGVTETVLGAGVLLLPYCVLAGFALTLGCAVLTRTDGAAGVGRAYIADSLGSIVGGVLFSFVLVRCFDHLRLLVFPALLNLASAALLFLARKPGSDSGSPIPGSIENLHGPKPRMPTMTPPLTRPAATLSPSDGEREGVRGSHGARRLMGRPGWRGCLCALVLFAALAFVAVFTDLDSLSTRLQYRQQQVLARANSPYGRLIVTASEGQYNFLENGIPFTSTRDDQHVEETVHYALAQRPDARRVLLIGGGISGTAREILKYPATTVDYVELDPLILELGRKYLPENLADPRIRAISADPRLFVRQAAQPYDVAIMDVAPPSTAQLNRYYTFEFLAELKRVLAPDGVVSFALGQYENYASPELARTVSSARRSLERSFRNVLALPGSRVFFLASDGPLFPDIAGRLEARRIATKLFNRHYLDAMLTPDRMAGLQAATMQPAAVNHDFSPILYYYHLRHWMSQFDQRVGPLQVGLVLLLVVYLLSLRGSARVLFASGFAGTALEIVLLLAFQVLCGSVYHQVGLVVTVFMLGLALGAWVTNRPADLVFLGFGPADLGPTLLRRLAWLIAVYAVLVPFCLPLLGRLGSGNASLFAVKSIILLLTLALAVLVGMQFPLANRLAFDGTVSGASRLYTADFVGAFAGALLTCTLLIPLAGVMGACLLTALLNIAAGAPAGRAQAQV
ncbi:MAG TPA: hypothetical protein VMU04_06550 [Candidatus Acidoferrum sp.]|nr:hypothetical protein [Candidatus Acidoferrum sp.]